MIMGDLQCTRWCFLLFFIFGNGYYTRCESEHGFYIRCDGENGVDVAEVTKNTNIKFSDLCWKGPTAMASTARSSDSVRFSVNGEDIGGVRRMEAERVNVSAMFANYTLRIPHDQPCGRMDVPVKAIFSTEVRNTSLHFHVKCNYTDIDLRLFMIPSPNTEAFSNNMQLKIQDGKTWLETFYPAGVKYITGWVQNNGNATLPFKSSVSSYIIVSYLTKSSTVHTDNCYNAFGTGKNIYNIGPSSTVLWVHTFQTGLGPGEIYNFSGPLNQVLQESIDVQEFQICGSAVLVTVVDPFNVANETNDTRRCNNFGVLNVYVNCDSPTMYSQNNQTCNVHPDPFDAGSTAVLTFTNGLQDMNPKRFKFEYLYGNTSIEKMNDNDLGLDQALVRKMGAIKVLGKVLEAQGGWYNCTDEDLQQDDEDDDVLYNGTKDNVDDMSSDENQTNAMILHLAERVKNATQQELMGITGQADTILKRLNSVLTDVLTMKAESRRQSFIGRVWGLQVLASARIGNVFTSGSDVGAIARLICNAANVIKWIKKGITSEYMKLIKAADIQNSLNNIIQLVSAASVVMKTVSMTGIQKYGCISFLDVVLNTLMDMKEHVANNTVTTMTDNWILQNKFAQCDEDAVIGKINPCLQRLLDYCVADKCEKITELSVVREQVCSMKRMSQAIRAGYRDIGLPDVQTSVNREKGWYRESGCPNPFAPKRRSTVIWERDGNNLMSGHILWDGRICWKTAAVCTCQQCPQSNTHNYGSMYEKSTTFPGPTGSFRLPSFRETE